MKIAVIGANGQLGVDVVNAFRRDGGEVFPLSHADLELSSLESVSAHLQTLRPDIVVNTAAMHHVDKCEQDPQKAFAVNGVGAYNLSIAARNVDAAIMHVSTDYVFDGAKGSPYEETDAPRPLNAYGNTKLSGEYSRRRRVPRCTVICAPGTAITRASLPSAAPVKYATP